MRSNQRTTADVEFQGMIGCGLGRSPKRPMRMTDFNSESSTTEWMFDSGHFNVRLRAAMEGWFHCKSNRQAEKRLETVKRRGCRFRFRIRGDIVERMVGLSVCDKPAHSGPDETATLTPSGHLSDYHGDCGNLCAMPVFLIFVLQKSVIFPASAIFEFEQLR